LSLHSALQVRLELTWEAAIIILDDHIAVVAILSDAKLADIEILQGLAPSTRKFFTNFHGRKLVPFGENFSVEP